MSFWKTSQAESRSRAYTDIAKARKFLQLVEREYSFLGTVVIELLVLEHQVFELSTEHQAGCGAGIWRPFGLQALSRLQRLVRTSRLRLTGVLQTLETRSTMQDKILLGDPHCVGRAIF